MRAHPPRFADETALGPADKVTLLRTVLALGVLVLAVRSWWQPIEVAWLVSLATVALILDGVDGKVARRTDTASPFGARFDLEADAFLLLALSLYVAPSTGWWVLLIGLARYLFVAARLIWPWLAGQAPPRNWCKVVAVVQGVALIIAASELLPRATNQALLAVALALLAESFGREAWELRPR